MRVLWSQFILKTLKKHVWNCLTIQNNWRLSIHKLSRLSRKLSGPSEKYQYYSETFQAIQKLNRPSGKYPDYPETFQPIWKLSRLSGNFPDHPENIQPIRKLSKGSGNFPMQFQGLRAKTFQMRKNFPDGNTTMPWWFLGHCKKETTTLVGCMSFSFSVLKMGWKSRRVTYSHSGTQERDGNNVILEFVKQEDHDIGIQL